MRWVWWKFWNLSPGLMWVLLLIPALAVAIAFPLLGPREPPPTAAEILAELREAGQATVAWRPEARERQASSCQAVDVLRVLEDNALPSGARPEAGDALPDSADGFEIRFEATDGGQRSVRVRAAGADACVWHVDGRVLGRLRAPRAYARLMALAYRSAFARLQPLIDRATRIDVVDQPPPPKPIQITEPATVRTVTGGLNFVPTTIDIDDSALDRYVHVTFTSGQGRLTLRLGVQDNVWRTDAPQLPDGVQWSLRLPPAWRRFLPDQRPWRQSTQP